MTILMPYFLRDESWYTEIETDEGNITYELTDQAPPEAIESFKEFNAMMSEENVDYFKPIIEY